VSPHQIERHALGQGRGAEPGASRAAPVLPLGLQWIGVNPY
jgi:hypothetical protein